MIGQTIGHYEILEPIGSGGMGAVYAAQDTNLGRRVAIKVLSDAMEREPGMLERFKREARAASALNHPGICTVHAIEEHQGRHFIVMELVEGQTLAELVGKESFDADRLVDLGVQLADALESAHSKGIVHRDLKPGNIMITARAQVKILDFGLAKTAAKPQQAVSADSGSRAETMLEDAHLTAVGTVLGTVAYMSPEQARGKLTDSRTDIFSLGTMLYQVAAGSLPFEGHTQAVLYDAILNRDPRPLSEVQPSLPPEIGVILDKALEKDRSLRYQTATELKTDLLRLRRKLDSGRHAAAASASGSHPSAEQGAQRSIAVLYFENLSGAKEDEYLRDGITEDIITELSKIKGLNIFSRPTVLAYRDKQVTPSQIGQQLNASHVLGGSIRRAGNRLRINAQLVDTHTDFPIWSERYDREMADVFELQDEIARKIAEALRITLSPQEEQELAAKPTDNLQAYDLYLRGRSYARRLTRQDLEFALQMFDNAVTQDPRFALAYAAIANVSAYFHCNYARQDVWIDRARAASQKAVALQPEVPEVMVAQAWILYAKGQYEEAIAIVSAVIERKPDCEGAYYLLLRALFAAGLYREVESQAEAALDNAGDDYNVYVPISNSLQALGKQEAVKNLRQRMVQALETHLREVPEDARARILLANEYANEGRGDDAMREADLAMLLRPSEATIHYNAACTFCALNEKEKAMDALRNAWRNGFKDSDWARRDTDLALLHGEAEFDELYPAAAGESG
ncbi:MAG TPA: protein kinase [Thermoanaerobaculia bacterium]|nr:protein kinase [Thermoanaerobaculia bacterium]